MRQKEMPTLMNANDHDLLISLSTKVDLLLTGQKENFNALSSQVTGIEGRTRLLEKQKDEFNPDAQLKRIGDNEKTNRDLVDMLKDYAKFCEKTDAMWEERSNRKYSLKLLAGVATAAASSSGIIIFLLTRLNIL